MLPQRQKSFGVKWQKVKQSILSSQITKLKTWQMQCCEKHWQGTCKPTYVEVWRLFLKFLYDRLCNSISKMERENRKESIKIAVESVVDITMQSLKTSPQVLNNPATASKRRTNKKIETPLSCIKLKGS